MGLVVMVVLLIGVLGIPQGIKHNGSAEGFVQVYLTYTLGYVVMVMGLTTLWLGCGLLSREIEENQMQLVTVRPIQRWEIWLGKWLGLIAFNGVALGVCSAVIYYSLSYHAGRLSEEQQRRLKETVLVSRSSVTEPAADRSLEIEAIFRERMKKEEVAKLGEEYVRSKVGEDVLMMDQVVNPQHMRWWNIDLPKWQQARISNGVAHIKFRFFAVEFQRGATYKVMWVVATRDGKERWRSEVNLAANATHEVSIPAGVIPENEPFRIECRNFNDMALIFPLEEPLEFLFPDGSFGLNYVRGMIILLCAMGLLGALGLFSSSFLSFPVATFLGLSAILLFSSGNLIQEVLLENTLGNTEQTDGPPDAVRKLDRVMLPVFRFFSGVLREMFVVSPIEFLTEGRSISMQAMLGTIFRQILVGSGLLSLAGMGIFSQRELATGQMKS
jgi:hypothetical protein